MISSRQEMVEQLRTSIRWYEAQGIQPLFPSGHGLSYTRFAYSHLQVTPTRTNGIWTIRIRFTVRNVGARPGTELAQAYVQLPESTGEPAKRLVRSTHVRLRPGQAATVQITLDRDDLADLHLLQHWDPATGDWATAGGTYRFHVGSCSETELEDTITIRG
jgi:beta-glucosidase